MVPALPPASRRAVLASAGAGLSGLAGCNFGYLGDTTSDRPPLWGESIRVGVLANSVLQHGEAIENGATTVAERINADGGVAGAGVELEVVDTEASARGIGDLHRDLCEERDCDLTVGLFLGSADLSILPSVAEQETVHLTTGVIDGRAGAHVADEYDAFRYHFRPGLPNYDDLGDALAEFVAANAADLGWERAALISENLGELETFHERLDESLPGVLEVPISQRPGGVSDWSPLYNEIESEDCDVAIVGMALGGPPAINQWSLQERDFAFGGLNLFATAPDYWAETDGNVEYTFSLDGLTRLSDNTGRTRGFVADYETRFGRPPVYSAATTYDSLKLYRQAVESIVEAGDSELPDQGRVVEALEDVTVTDGLVYDEFEFTGPGADLAHEPVWTSMVDSGVPIVQQWQRDAEGIGVRKAIAPDGNATADYQSPPWLG